LIQSGRRFQCLPFAFCSPPGRGAGKGPG
jgi:hypothetical protein